MTKCPLPATAKAESITGREPVDIVTVDGVALYEDSKPSPPIKLPLFYLLSDGASLQEGPDGRIIRVPPKAKP